MKKLLFLIVLFFLIVQTIPVGFAQFKIDQYAHTSAQGSASQTDTHYSSDNDYCKDEQPGQNSSKQFSDFGLEEQTDYGSGNADRLVARAVKILSHSIQGSCADCKQVGSSSTMRVFGYSEDSKGQGAISGFDWVHWLEQDNKSCKNNSSNTDLDNPNASLDFYGYEFGLDQANIWTPVGGDWIDKFKQGGGAGDYPKGCGTPSVGDKKEFDCICTGDCLGGQIQSTGARICYYGGSESSSFYYEDYEGKKSGSSTRTQTVTDMLSINKNCGEGDQYYSKDNLLSCAYYNYDTHTEIGWDKSHGTHTSTENQSWFGVMNHLSSGSCDDGDECTFDYCGGKNGCIHTPIPGCDKDHHPACVNSACVIVEGTGPAECHGNSDCQGTHSICQNQACTEVSGNGISECTSNSDCSDSHSICYSQACITVQGTGTNECASNNDCAPQHTECQNNACAVVNGSGSDQCKTNDDCAKDHHTVCSDKACISTEGPGVDQCSSSQDCDQHSECRQQACITVAGSGTNQCTSSKDCESPKHLDCVGSSCQTVDGAGADQCLDYYDCQKETHLECQNQACAQVQGPGRDACVNDSDCRETHLECQNQACVSVFGSGSNLCTKKEDCCDGGNCDSHLVCQNKACVQVQGQGANQCRSNTDCKDDAHTVCENSACVEVSGAGTNECTVGQWCDTDYTTHLECRNKACTAVSGTGIDLCNTSTDCERDQHLTCQNESCQVVDGGGIDQCASNSDCQPTHLECKNSTCQQVSGYGQNKCTSDFECNWHTACDTQTNRCAPVFGPGKNECTYDSECAPPTYLKCDYTNEQCLQTDCPKEGCPTDECRPDRWNGKNKETDCRADGHYACNLETKACDWVDGAGNNECLPGNDCTQAPRCELTVNPDAIQTGENTRVQLNLHNFTNGFDAILVSCGNNAGNATLQNCVQNNDTWTCTGVCGVYEEPGTFTIGDGLLIKGVACTPATIRVGGNNTQNGTVFIEKMVVQPLSVPQASSLESITIAVQNTSQNTCNSGTLLLEFTNSTQDPVGISSVQHTRSFAPGTTQDVFEGGNGKEFDTGSLTAGIYAVQVTLSCENNSDKKRVFFTVFQTQQTAIPETNWMAIILLLIGVLTVLFQHPKKQK